MEQQNVANMGAEISMITLDMTHFTVKPIVLTQNEEGTVLKFLDWLRNADHSEFKAVKLNKNERFVDITISNRDRVDLSQ